jgi:hypothetical protein
MQFFRKHTVLKTLLKLRNNFIFNPQILLIKKYINYFRVFCRFYALIFVTRFRLKLPAKQKAKFRNISPKRYILKNN